MPSSHRRLRALGAQLSRVTASASGAAAPTPFSVSISQDMIDDLNYRLDHTRWPNGQLEGGDWLYGAKLEFMQQLCAHCE